MRIARLCSPHDEPDRCGSLQDSKEAPELDQWVKRRKLPRVSGTRRGEVLPCPVLAQVVACETSTNVTQNSNDPPSLPVQSCEPISQLGYSTRLTGGKD